MNPTQRFLGNTVLDNSAIMLNGQQWWFNYNDTDPGTNFTGDLGVATSFVTLTVPELRAAMLGGLGLLALLRRRRQSMARKILAHSAPGLVSSNAAT
jgi:hypothetical protein